MATELQQTISDSVLGQKVPYPSCYDKKLLFPVERSKQRRAMNISPALIMKGYDVWNAYELFWLDLLGKPVRSYATFLIPSDSLNICESKSVKLYLHSLNHERFEHAEEVARVIAKDLSEICRMPIKVFMTPPSMTTMEDHSYQKTYWCLDHLNVVITTYERTPELITTASSVTVEEKLLSHLFKSHCLCTGQPDLGSIFIDYRGPQLNHEGLLAYLVSYRDHVGFSENCIEQIFVDVMERIRPEKLLVFGRFTRRGGIDINPYRANFDVPFQNLRLMFQ